MEATKESLYRDIEKALVDIRARIRGHAGDLIVSSVEDGAAKLEFLGACRGCPAQAFTLVAVVEPALLGVNGIQRVEAPRMASSPAVLRRIRKMMESTKKSNLFKRSIRLFIIDEEEGFLRLLLPDSFIDAGIEVVGTATTFSEAKKLIAGDCVDVLLFDHCEAAGRGSKTVKEFIERYPKIGVVFFLENERPLVMTEGAGNSGATFITHDDNFEKMIASIRGAVKFAA